MIVSFVLLSSCDQSREFEAHERRELTSLDARIVDLQVTSKERFEAPSDSTGLGGESSEPQQSLDYTKPDGWTKEASSMFRNLNFSIDAGGEAYVSLVGGQVLGNVNRWYGQFGESPRTMAQLEAGEKVTIFGKEAYLIKATGNYNAGMGKPAQEDVTLIGAVTTVESGLLTVKLIAPTAIAGKQEPSFKEFCQSLRQLKP